MAHRSDLEASVAKVVSIVRLRRPQSKEPRTIPSRPGDLVGDLGEAIEGFAVVGEPALEYRDTIGLSIPSPHQLGTGLDAPGQFQAPVGFGGCSPHELLQKLSGGGRKAAVDLFL